MKKINLPPFYIGQKVENVKRKTKHVITFVTQEFCGCWSVCVDGAPPIKQTTKLSGFRCNVCRKEEFIRECIYGEWDSKCFRAIQEQSYPLITFSKIKEVEKDEILISN